MEGGRAKSDALAAAMDPRDDDGSEVETNRGKIV